MGRRLRVLPAFFALAIVIAGCGKASPTSAVAGGATISGSVVGSGAGGQQGAPSPSTGVVVAVPGTSLGTTVDMNDNFTLNNVPPGNINLQFTGQGVNSQVALGAIQQGDRIIVIITRTGPSMFLENIRRMGGDGEELEGRIDGLPPATAAGTFTISGQNVQTSASTKFTKGDAPATFADLAIGMRVHVKGAPNAGGVAATVVRIQNDNVDLGVEVEGPIANLSGVATAFQFTVNGRLIKGDATTAFETGSGFSGLANGARVEVKGLLRVGFILATRIEFH